MSNFCKRFLISVLQCPTTVYIHILEHKLFYYFIRFYLFIWERAQAGGRCRGRSRLPTEQGAQCRTRSQDPMIMTWAEGRCLTDCATQAAPPQYFFSLIASFPVCNVHAHTGTLRPVKQTCHCCRKAARDKCQASRGWAVNLVPSEVWVRPLEPFFSREKTFSFPNSEVTG